MATLAATSVTINRAWNEGGPSGRDLSCRLVTIVTDGSPGNGSATNLIPATALALTTIEQAGTFLNTTDTDIVLATPDSTGANLFLYNMNNATDATRSDPVDFISKTLKGVVKGYQ